MPTEIETKYLDRYGFTDPAGTKQRLRKARARQAIVVVGVDHLMRIFVLHASAGRTPASVYVDRIIKVCENWTPRIFGIEANAMQELFADLVIEKARELKKRLPLTGVNQPTRIDKDFRIRTTLQPVINAGRLFLQENQDELETELRGFPTAATKDLVDCLASAIALVPQRTKPQQKNDEAQKLAAYLRETGAPSWYIEKRIKELYELDIEKGMPGSPLSRRP